MKILLAVITLLISTFAQARDCSESWKNQDLEHVEFLRNQLKNEVKNILISSYDQIGVEITQDNIDFETTIISKETVAEDGSPFTLTTIGYNVAHVNTGDKVTDFVVRAYKPYLISNSETWTVFSRLRAEPMYNAIGDLVAVECSVQSNTAAKFSTGLELVLSFSIRRKENDFLVSSTKANYTYESSEEIH